MKIKIPIGLASHYANHRSMIRILAAYCRLKAFDSSSSIVGWRNRIEELAEFSHCSARTLESRVYEMRSIGLAKIEKGDLQLISWEQLWTITSIPFKKKSYWYIDNEKINCRLEYQLQFLAIKEKQRTMERAYFTRAKNTPGYLSEIKRILGVEYTQPISMQEHLAGLLDAFSHDDYQPMDIYMLNLYNPDNQISCSKMQDMFGYADKSFSGPSYRKMVLAKLGLITIEKRIIESPVRTRKCISGTVNYSRRTKKTFLRLCDRISAPL